MVCLLFLSSFPYSLVVLLPLLTVLYLDLCREIERETGFPVAFEGIYRWITFLPSRMHSDVPVLNRYLGVFESGLIKARGIESRRHDTPRLVSKCQEAMLAVLSEASDAESVVSRIPHALQVLKRYADSLRRYEVSVDDLVITKFLSKNPENYEVDIVQSFVARQLAEEGLHLLAGQRVQYVMTNDTGEHAPKRGLAVQLTDSGMMCDTVNYLKLLISAAATLLNPFDCSEARIAAEIS